MEHKYVVFENKESTELTWAVFFASEQHSTVALQVTYKNKELVPIRAGFLKFISAEESPDGTARIDTYGGSTTLQLKSHVSDSAIISEKLDIDNWVKDPFQDPVYHPDIFM